MNREMKKLFVAVFLYGIAFGGAVTNIFWVCLTQ